MALSTQLHIAILTPAYWPGPCPSTHHTIDGARHDHGACRACSGWAAAPHAPPSAPCCTRQLLGNHNGSTRNVTRIQPPAPLVIVLQLLIYTPLHMTFTSRAIGAPPGPHHALLYLAASCQSWNTRPPSGPSTGDCEPSARPPANTANASTY